MSDQLVWIVHGGYGLWVVRAATAEEACDVAYNGPATDDTTASEYGINRDELEAYLVEAGPPAIIDHYFG